MSHQHDYVMHFEDPVDPLRFTLRCECGDVAPSMDEALRRMSEVPLIERYSTLLWWLVTCAALLTVVLVLLHRSVR
jgi:hypothetical protein